MQQESILTNYSSFSCRRMPVGLIGIRAHGGRVTDLLFMHVEPSTALSAPGSRLIDEAFQQLEAWFSGRLREFALPLVEPRSAFERRVREAMLAIPYGQTASYGELAAAIGSPGAARAVGTWSGRPDWWVSRRYGNETVAARFRTQEFRVSNILPVTSRAGILFVFFTNVKSSFDFFVI